MKNRHPFIPNRAHVDSDFREAKTAWSERLLHPDKRLKKQTAGAAAALPYINVVGVGIGEKLSENKLTGTMSVKFFVRRKYPDTKVGKKNQLPKTVHGLPTDVEEVGTFRALAGPPNPRTRIRPAQPGCSVGFLSPAIQTVGTFGALVRDASGLFILSNNHVLANENHLPLNSPIFEPSLKDGGKPADKIAELSNFVALQPGAAFNTVDCAIARAPNTLVSNSILKLGPPLGKGVAQLSMEVHKFGRTTEYTVGRIASVDTDMTMTFNSGSFNFRKQIVITGLGGIFAADGDSGALVLERGTQKAVGLLFGVGINSSGIAFAIANHIDDVLSALGVSLVF